MRRQATNDVPARPRLPTGWRTATVITAAIVLTAAIPARAAPELSPAQSRLIALLTYIQVARDRCGYGIDVDVLRLVARQSSIDFGTDQERRARDEGFRDAERAFAGMRQSVECSYALQRYGPEGAEFRGLLERGSKREPSP